MTTEERTRIAWLLDEMDYAATHKPEILPALVGLLRRSINGVHGAASHGAKRGRRPKAAAVEPGAEAPPSTVSRPSFSSMMK